MSKTPKEEAQALRQGTQSAMTELQLAQEQEAIDGRQAKLTDQHLVLRDMVNQMLGRTQFSHALAQINQATTAISLKNVKENKLYLALKGVVAIDRKGREIANVGTFDGYCQAVGISRAKADEDIKNLEVLGPEAYENMQAAGISYREMRKLRRLPANDREAIIDGEAVRLGDKDEIVALIDDLAAKYAHEKEELERRNASLQTDLESSRGVSAKKERRITELEEEIHKAERLAPDERARGLSEKLDRATWEAKAGFLSPEAVIHQIMAWEDAPRDLRHACAQAVARLRIALDELQLKYYLPTVDLDVDDSWMPGDPAGASANNH